MLSRLFKFCLTLSFCLAVAGCIPTLWDSTSPKSDIDLNSIDSGQKALVIFRANTPDGSTVETRWQNLSTGEEKRVSTQFFALTGEATREYDLVTLDPGEYVLTYAVYGGFKTWTPLKMDPKAGPYSELGQVVVRQDEKDGRKTQLYALTSHGTDGSGKPLIASFSVKGGEVVYIGDMTIDFTYTSPGNLSEEMKAEGYFSANSVSLGLSNQRTRAKNSLLEVHPPFAEKMQYVPLKHGKLAKKH